MTTATRISFGEEVRSDGGSVVQYVPVRHEFCPECDVRRGQPHVPGCHLEQCPVCGEPLAHCGHRRQILG